jgi:NAD(P)-dependent dehydrogenase (short-subunit alcohol dehydrogenase family)
MFQNKVVVITGGANGIGQCIAEAFARSVIREHVRVDVLVNNASPLFLGIDGGQTRLMIYHNDCGWSYQP